MDFKQAFITCAVEKRFNWQDRASRSEFWWFYLATVGIGIVAAIFNAIPLLGQVIALVINVAVWWLTTIAAIRRLHDIEKSGFWLLLPGAGAFVGITLIVIGLLNGSDLLFSLGILVAIGGSGFIVYLLVKPGTPGPNKYGPNPLANAAYAAPAMAAAPVASEMQAPAANEPAVNANEPASVANEPAPAANEAAPQNKDNNQQ